MRFSRAISLLDNVATMNWAELFESWYEKTYRAAVFVTVTLIDDAALLAWIFS